MNQGTQDVSASITAAGTTQATATLLINGINLIGTAAAGTGVVLSSNATPGSSQTVYNGGANAVNVFPPLGSKINGLATNSGMVLATNTTCHFWFANSTQIIGLLSA
jgi:hypothetical protein